MRRMLVKQKQYVDITPTDTTKYPAQLENYYILTLDGTEQDYSLYTYQPPDVTLQNTRVASRKSLTRSIAFSNKLKCYGQNLWTSHEEENRINVFSEHPTDKSIYMRIIDSREEQTVQDNTDLLAQKYAENDAYMFLLKLEVPDGSIWKAVKQVATNKLGYYNASTNEFMEVYGLTGTVTGDLVDLIPYRTMLCKLGKNLFDKDGTVTSNRYLKADGTIASNSTMFISPYIEVSPNTDYSFSYSGASVAICMCVYDANMQYISGADSSAAVNKTITLNTTANGKYIRFSDLVARKSNSMLNEGSTALPYEPYGLQLIPYRSLFVKKSKNLFDTSAITGFLDCALDTDGTIYTTTTNSTIRITIDKDHLKEIFSEAGSYYLNRFWESGRQGVSDMRLWISQSSTDRLDINTTTGLWTLTQEKYESIQNAEKDSYLVMYTANLPVRLKLSITKDTAATTYEPYGKILL